MKPETAILLSPSRPKGMEAIRARELRIETAHRQYHRWLLLLAFRWTGNWHDAEDLMQILWRRVYLSFADEQIGRPGILKHKLKQLFIDHYYRPKARRLEVVTDVPPEEEVPETETADFSIGREQELRSRFWEGFPGIDLTDQQKNLLWSYARYGHTMSELSRRTGIPVATIGDNIQLARKRVADYLNTERS